MRAHFIVSCAKMYNKKIKKATTITNIIMIRNISRK